MTSRCTFKRPEEPFLALSTCRIWIPLAEAWGVSKVARSPMGFMTAYEEAEGKVSNLSCHWRTRRSNFNHSHYQGILKRERGRLWQEEGKWAGLPTRHALSLVMWAWHHDPGALRRSVEVLRDLEL